MAKIALLTKKLTPEALGLAQALQFHRHEVLMITSHTETVPDGLGYQVLTYFKTWSAVEALKFFPRMLGHNPEVWHFVFADQEQEYPTAAHWVLANLARALPGRVVAASFYDSLFHTPARKALPLLKSCDIVTTATRENLMYIKRKAWLNKFAETEVLPPFLPASMENESEVMDQDLQQLIRAAQPYLLIPSETLPDQDWELILNKVNLIVCGARPLKSLNGIYYVGANLSPGQFAELLKKSRGLITAFEDLSVVELLKYHKVCSKTETVTLAHPRQTEALPGFCVPKRNGFLISSMSDLNRLLHENPRLEVQTPKFEFVRSDLADSALNELNRLYSKVRHSKTTAIDFKRSPQA